MAAGAGETAGCRDGPTGSVAAESRQASSAGGVGLGKAEAEAEAEAATGVGRAGARGVAEAG